MTVQAGVRQLFLGDIRTSAFGTLCDMACLLGNPSVTAAFSVAMKVWNVFISTSTEPSPGDLIQRFVVDHLFHFLLVHHDPSGDSAFFVCDYYITEFAVKQSVIPNSHCHPALDVILSGAQRSRRISSVVIPSIPCVIPSLSRDPHFQMRFFFSFKRKRDFRSNLSESASMVV
jgi:hypothetical protein